MYVIQWVPRFKSAPGQAETCALKHKESTLTCSGKYIIAISVAGHAELAALNSRMPLTLLQLETRFMGTKLLDFSMGRGSGALKGLTRGY